jgi:hypothetical protein
MRWPATGHSADDEDDAADRNDGATSGGAPAGVHTGRAPAQACPAKSSAGHPRHRPGCCTDRGAGACRFFAGTASHLRRGGRRRSAPPPGRRRRRRRIPGGEPRLAPTLGSGTWSGGRWNGSEASGRPVVVSMGSVAGSGGYFVALSADLIVAHSGDAHRLDRGSGRQAGAPRPLLDKAGIRFGAVRRGLRNALMMCRRVRTVHRQPSGTSWERFRRRGCTKTSSSKKVCRPPGG